MLGNMGSPQEFWNSATFTFKFFAIVSLAVFLISLLIPSFAVFLIDIPVLTTTSFQVWRLITSFLGQLPNIYSVIYLLFSFLWIRTIIKVFQK